MQDFLRAWLISLTLVLAASTAHAQSVSDPRWFGGISLGHSRSDVAEAALDSTGLSSAPTLSKDSASSAYKLYAGQRLERNLAIEVGYTDFGKYSASRAPSTANVKTANVKVSGFHAALVGFYPVDGNVELLAKLGLARLKIEKDYSSVLNNTDTANSLMGGIGVEYRLSRSLGMRLEYEYFVNGVYVSPYGTTHDSTIGLVSVGLKFRF